MTAAEAAAVGARLKERLREAKIPIAPVLASLGRDRVIVKDIRYPAVPATRSRPSSASRRSRS